MMMEKKKSTTTWYQYQEVYYPFFPRQIPYLAALSIMIEIPKSSKTPPPPLSSASPSSSSSRWEFVLASSLCNQSYTKRERERVQEITTNKQEEKNKYHHHHIQPQTPRFIINEPRHHFIHHFVVSHSFLSFSSKQRSKKFSLFTYLHQHETDYKLNFLLLPAYY